jgi:MerR family mercuric resistance operon transcriptional regulator
MAEGGMTIGRLAKSVGVNVETVRYYQRRGLIDSPSKPLAGHRRYPASVLGRINFIRRAQQLGFTLAEVKSLLELSDGTNVKETCKIAERRFEALELHIAQLQKMHTQLKALIAECKKVKGRKFDPIIAALQQE